MSHYDAKETQAPEQRAAAVFDELRERLRSIVAAPAWADKLAGVDPATVTNAAALAALPITRKSELMDAQRAAPPFGGFLPEGTAVARMFVSPGPVFVPQGFEADPFNTARALYAAGVRRGDVVVNTFGYHATPGAFILESGLAALGCTIFAIGPGKADEALPTIAASGATVYCGVPDYLNILLDRAEAAGTPLPLRHALVSGAALPPDLRARIEGRGVTVLQCYATADLGVIAYESDAREGLIVNEDVILEIVRPGTGDPVAEGEVGEVVVTGLNPTYPLIRFATGDLSAVLPGPSPCGRTNTRIKGWMGRADQRTKVKGMFVDPAQIAEVRRRHPEIAAARLVVDRADHTDTMTLLVDGPEEASFSGIAATLKAVTNLTGSVAAAPPGGLPNDGKVIADERPVAG
ncbi:MAG: AMP-binding protein [Pseudomonadota bacterium]